MRASELIRKIIKECGGSESAVKAMESLAEIVLSDSVGLAYDHNIMVEVNGGQKFVIKDVTRHFGSMDLMLQIEITEDEVKELAE